MDFVHIRPMPDDNKSSALTLAILKKSHNYHLGWAFCSPRDQFSKKMGRTIASGRLAKRPLIAETKEQLKALLHSTLSNGIRNHFVLKSNALNPQTCLREAREFIDNWQPEDKRRLHRDTKKEPSKKEPCQEN